MGYTPIKGKPCLICNGNHGDGPCHHPHIGICRVPYTKRDGVSGHHLGEMCLICGRNMRGPGVWVPHREVSDRSINSLPVAPKLLGDAAEPTLFSQETEGGDA